MKETCQWTEDWGGDWNTECGERRVVDGLPSAHGMRFCCCCGKPLVEKLYDEEEEGADAQR